MSLFGEREHIIKEILETEKKYVKDLNNIVNIYQKPLEQAAIVDEKILKSIFKNLNIIIGLNTNLQKQLEFQKLSGVWSGGNSVGKIFVKWAPFLKTYTEYCNQFETSAASLRDLRKQNTKFDDYLRKLEIAHKSTGGLALSQYLIIPVQRIPRYSLLLRELEKQMDPKYDDLDNLIKAMDTIKNVASFMNDKLKLFDSAKKMYKIQARLDRGVLVPPGSNPNTPLPPTSGNKRATVMLKDFMNQFKIKSDHNHSSSFSFPSSTEVVERHNIIEPHRNFLHEGTMCFYTEGELECAPVEEDFKRNEKLTYLFSDMILFCESGPVPESLTYNFEFKFDAHETIPWIREFGNGLIQYVGKKSCILHVVKEEKDVWMQILQAAIDKLVDGMPDHEKKPKTLPRGTPEFIYDRDPKFKEKEDEEIAKIKKYNEDVEKSLKERVPSFTDSPKVEVLPPKERHVSRRISVGPEVSEDGFSMQDILGNFGGGRLNLGKYEEHTQVKRVQNLRILEKEQEERERTIREEKEQIENERLEKEKKERDEKDRLFQAHQERMEKEKIERLERAKREKEESDRLALENVERLRLEKERIERDRQERLVAEQMERERQEREEEERIRLEKEEDERIEREKAIEFDKLEKSEKEKVIRDRRLKKPSSHKSLDKEVKESELRQTREDLIKIVEEKEYISIRGEPKETIDRLVALYLDQSRDQSKKMEYCRIIDDIKRKKFKKK